ncbi:hypothetical protein [Romboutsia sp.]|uniref:hypothetical protein n=1 Tax=Romboutsia sp. TaxID=1965302 RepID=UPI003F30DAEF
MKKNKTIAFVMAAGLLIGGTFAGTKAWFTDQEVVNNDLVITTGDIEVDANDEEEKWVPVYKTIDGEYTQFYDKAAPGTSKVEVKEDGANKSFTNVRPGDVFRKEINVKNTGTLNQIVKTSGGDDVDGDNFEVISGSITNYTLKPGEATSFQILVKVSEAMDSKKRSGSENTEFILEKAMTPIVIEANQVNKK